MAYNAHNFTAYLCRWICSVWPVPFSKDCNLVKFYEVNMYFDQKISKFPKNLEVFYWISDDQLLKIP
jgi:hypothetical protein